MYVCALVRSREFFRSLRTASRLFRFLKIPVAYRAPDRQCTYSTRRKAWRLSVWLWPRDSLCNVTTCEDCRIWQPTNVNLSFLNINSPSSAMTSLFWQQCHCFKLTTPFALPCSPDSGTNPLPVRRSRAIVLDQSPTSRPCLVRPTAFSIPGDGTIEFRYFLLRIFPWRIQ
jgi:hypothetical protein